MVTAAGSSFAGDQSAQSNIVSDRVITSSWKIDLFKFLLIIFRRRSTHVYLCQTCLTILPPSTAQTRRPTFRQLSMNSSMVITPSWFRSSFLNTLSSCSLAFLSSSAWCPCRLPISSWTAVTTSPSSPLVMQPSPLMS